MAPKYQGEDEAAKTILSWLEKWAKDNGTRNVGHIHFGGRRTFIDLEERKALDYVYINIADDELRAFIQHPEYAKYFKWIMAHEYGHLLGYALYDDAAMRDPLDWESDDCQDYADRFADKVSGVTRDQAREATHRYAPKAIWTDASYLAKQRRVRYVAGHQKHRKSSAATESIGRSL